MREPSLKTFRVVLRRTNSKPVEATFIRYWAIFHFQMTSAGFLLNKETICSNLSSVVI
jgi:hypothetical protein